MKKLVDEKLETVKRMSDVEIALTNSEDEYTMMKDMYEREVDENRFEDLDLGPLSPFLNVPFKFVFQ